MALIERSPYYHGQDMPIMYTLNAGHLQIRKADQSSPVKRVVMSMFDAHGASNPAWDREQTPTHLGKVLCKPIVTVPHGEVK